MISLPLQLLEDCDTAEHSQVVAWWTDLEESARVELAFWYDPRSDTCSFSPVPAKDGEWRWRRLPLRVSSWRLGRDEDRDIDWRPDYFEYQLVHPEIFPLPLLLPRTFHIA
jgi:hypothetical protein